MAQRFGMNAASVSAASSSKRASVSRAVSRWHFRYVAGGVTVALAVYTFVALWFVERAPEWDELGLFNPVYMFDRAGAVTYPIYPATGATSAMFVHPPTHYFILGLLMRLHLSAEGAALVPVILWTVVAIAAAMFCRFSIVARFAISAGVIAGILVWALPFFIRPDVDMAVTWIAALIVLEGGRLGGWNPALLAFGAFLLTLASELHYPMTPAFLGLVVYAVWMVRDLGLRPATPRLGALIGGALIPGIPYLALFVIPHYGEIRGFAQGTNGSGFHPLLAFREEIAGYRSIVASGQGGTLLSAIAAPFTYSRVPPAVAFVPFFFWRRDTRGIALACLPPLFFLWFFDTENHQLYVTGEFTLYFIAVAYAVGLGVARLIRALGPTERVASLAAALAVLVALLVFGRPAIDTFGTRTLHPAHREMDIARAAGRAGIGEAGLVTSFDASTLWYTTGGSAYYPLWRDISYQTNLQQLNLRAYLKDLPALAESNVGTAISYWAAAGLVTARAFYFDWPLTSARVALAPKGQGWAGTSRIRYILYSGVPAPVAGVALDRHNNALIFTTQSDGAWEFVSESCQGTSTSIADIGPWSLSADVPASVGTGGARSAGPRTIVSVVARPAAIAHSATLREHHCKVLRAARLSARTVTVHQLLSNAKTVGVDRTMAFPGWVAAVDTLLGPRGRLTHLDFNEPVKTAAPDPGGTVRASPAGLSITTPSRLYAQAATIPLKLPDDRSQLWIGMNVRVTKGTVGMCVIDVVTNACTHPLRQLIAPGSGLVYLEVPDTKHPVAVYIENVAYGSAEMTVRGRADLVRAAAVGSRRP